MKKMKIVALAIITLAVVLPMSSCKKGPNDPSISLKSRDARITAEWKLTAITGTTVQNYLGTQYTITHNYNGTTYSIASNGSTSSGVGAFTMTIDKDGVFTYNETYTDDGASSANVVSGEGQWFWAGNDNSKVAVILPISNSSFFSTNSFIVDELKSKELILHVKGIEVENGITSSADLYYTFENQK